MFEKKISSIEYDFKQHYDVPTAEKATGTANEHRNGVEVAVEA